MKTRIYVKEPRGTLLSDRINGSKGTNSREKIPLGTSVSIDISRQFVTMESKYAFAIYLNTQYLGPNTWAGLARFAEISAPEIQLSNSFPGLAGLFNFVITWP